MKLLGRLVLLGTAVLLLSHYLPHFFRLLTEQRLRAPTVFYSAVEQRFLFSRRLDDATVIVDDTGKRYERAEVERLLPLDSWRQLLSDGRLPREIRGTPLTREALVQGRLTLRFRPFAFDTPGVPLRPVIQTETGRLKLQSPDDFLRLGTAVEFIDARSNRVDTAKSARFAGAFRSAGFVLPATVVGGNPSTMKSYDEGWFLADASGAVFQLRDIDDQPVLDRISDIAAPAERPRWAALKPRQIVVQEQDSRELRAVILDDSNQVHVATGEDYRLTRLPLEQFDPSTTSLSVRGDMLNRVVTLTTSTRLEAVVLDRDYQLVARHVESLPTAADTSAGRLARVIFPFTLEWEDDSSGYLGVHLAHGAPAALGLNALLTALLAGWPALRRQLRPDRPTGLAATSAAGLFGLLSAVLIPRVGR